jgi:hypothetical protein
LKNFYKEARHGLQVALLYVGCTAADFISSLRIKPPSHSEENPFARHADGSFWPWHALINDSLNSLEIGLLSICFYVAARPLGWKARRFAAGLPWLYFGYVHLEAAFWNLQSFWPHLYVVTYREVLQRIMGN